MAGYRYDTGWLPDDSEEIQVRFYIQLGGLLDDDLHAAGVNMASDVVTSWPPPLSVGLEGREEGGRLRVAYGIELVVELRVEFEYEGIRVRDTREIPIPYVSDIVDRMQMEGETRFTPTSLGEWQTVRGTSERFTVFEYDILGAILDPIEVFGIDIDFSGGFRLDLEGFAEARYMTNAIAVDGAGEPITLANSTAIIDPPTAEGYGGSQMVVIEPTGDFECDVGVSLIPTLFVEILDWSLDWDYPIDFEVDGTETDAIFERQELTVSLPDLTVDPAVIDLGSVPAGRPIEEIVTITNDGEAPLDVDLSPMSSGITVSEESLSLEPREDAFVIISADLSRVDAAEAGVLLETNDPDSPRVTIGVLGETIEPPDDPEIPDDPDDPDAGPDAGPEGDGGSGTPIDDGPASLSGGCNCRAQGSSGGSGSIGLMMLLMGILLTRYGVSRRA